MLTCPKLPIACRVEDPRAARSASPRPRSVDVYRVGARRMDGWMEFGIIISRSHGAAEKRERPTERRTRGSLWEGLALAGGRWSGVLCAASGVRREPWNRRRRRRRRGRGAGGAGGGGVLLKERAGTTLRGAAACPSLPRVQSAEQPPTERDTLEGPSPSPERDRTGWPD
ncbi:hypothetical protein MPTK1_1g08010 [Marchantia polymorpha subsp. ruderalis]|uniref:Uncharacterized protein n=2 Tax=Marchantia polymorpha TaxID=3197 RepID=A0AAF6AMS9_MARPO|nr:hypothetical protein MARPO_0036s0045 [Marchantia polymorpha]BBM97749.1 hypothetical protein Mp_1g08010 [Marchantia polymorpha subsp. ruderalis]|eukprot:PTQ41053.1 hypothetical protein MARPO_0036s0045 [Marchantia polymorpha]